MTDSWAPLSAVAPHPCTGGRLVILSYGLGVDSTAILVRWLTDPASRDFDLADLVVVVAMTGDEWEVTGRHVEEHILPLLREHGVRLVQVARSGRLVRKDGTGVAILDDSTAPPRLHLGGVYKLSDELLEAGTVPQTGGERLCSVHAKGDVLDPVIGRLTAGRPYRHVVGFEANECRRTVKDTGYNTPARTGEYPLIEWGWDREACEEYLAAMLGTDWQKSACYYCPFALSNKAGRARVLARYAADPQIGARALLLERVALCLNPRQALVGRHRLIDLVRAAELHDVLVAFDRLLAATPHTLYDVRRVHHGPKNTARSIRRPKSGAAPLAELLPRFTASADARGLRTVVGDDGITRVPVEAAAPGTYPSRERFLVLAPAVVLPKERDQFPAWWERTPAA